MKRTHVVAVRVIMLGPLCAAFLLTGCQRGREFGPTVQVSGKVTLDGKPFSEGSVWFTSLRSGAGFHTELGPDGSYSVSILDVKIGETYAVFIGGVEPKGDEVDGAGIPVGPAPPPVPAKYRDGTTSGLTATIDNPEKAACDFELKSE